VSPSENPPKKSKGLFYFLLNLSSLRHSEHEPYWAEDRSSFIQIKVLLQEFQITSDIRMKTLFLSLLIITITFTFVLLKSGAEFSLTFVVVMLLTDATALFISNYTFMLVTRFHILSKEIITRSVRQSKGESKYESKFWKGMSPLRFKVGNFCTFETMEFLLFIWGEVILTKIIELLVAF